MEDAIRLTYEISPDDFTRAGEASSSVKNKLKKMGLDSNTIRKVSIAMYEGEINMVIHADGGTITVEISSEKIRMILADTGPGIADIDKAMENGYSTAPEEVRSLGFGAGMGLPNMKKYTDSVETDKLGNVIATFPGTDKKTPSIMVFAHMDTIGFVITCITADGFLKVDRVGGVPEKVLQGKGVRVGSESGNYYPGYSG